jgi:putative hemolysin
MSFVQKNPLFIDRDPFVIRTIDNDNDLEKVLKLRHKVFYEELLNKSLESKLDQDEFDSICDHLVISNDKNEIIGTYRLILSDFSNKFYSETEFDLTEIKKLEGKKLELGRACIEKEYRVSGALMMLWKGIFEYAKLLDVSYIFGCSSIKEINFYEVARICNKFIKEGYAKDLRIDPIDEYKIDKFDSYVELVDNQEPKEKIPVLFRSYLKAGVTIHKEPAIDKDFKCIDFFTMLKFNNMNEDLKAKLQ